MNRTGSLSSGPTRPGSPRSRSRNSSTSLGHLALSIDDDRKTFAGKAAAYGAFRGLTTRPLSTKKRGKSRLRWLLLATVVMGVWWWTRGGPTPDDANQQNDNANTVPTSRMTTGQGAMDQEARPYVRRPDELRAEAEPPRREEVAMRPTVKRPARRPLTSTVPGSNAIDVDVAPPPLAETLIDPAPPIDRYLAYSPHSGYHNQRISLENALTLAYMLKRTLLVPPVWVGHAIPYISFDKLDRRLAMASKSGLERCKDFGDGGSEDPLPRECVGYFSWTQLGWDFIVDLNEARKIVPMKERWNLTDAWLREELGLDSKVRTDRYDLKDDVLYQYRYYDSSIDNEPLAKFENRVDVLKLARDTREYKLVHLGTLFGTSRVRTTTDAAYEARSAFRRSMVFRNALLDDITESVRQRLGGPGQYYGLHLRVGDGIFQKSAAQNMAGVWQNLCVVRMNQPQELCDRLAAKHRRTPSLHARSKVPAGLETKIMAWYNTTPSSPPNTPLTKRANSHKQRQGAYKHAPLPPLPVIRTFADSPLASTLKCRGALHTAEDMLPFNAPVFIATDSKLPTEDPHLALFFSAFPCSFVLNDFSSASDLNPEPVAAFNELAGLRNQDDKVPLAQFLYPQLDAQIAAYGRGLIGTPQSTYSRFAVDVLHQTYHGWDIIERG